jgi:hypothetical protein
MEVSKKIALIDIDGCLSDYPNDIFLDLVRKEFGFTCRTKSEVIDKIGLSEYKSLKYKLRLDPGFKLSYKFRRDSLAVFSKLNKMGFEIWIYTSRPNLGSNHKTTYDWLSENNVKFDKLYFTAQKGESYLFSRNLEKVIVVDDEDKAIEPYLGDDNVTLYKFGGDSKYSGVNNVKDWNDLNSRL